MKKTLKFSEKNKHLFIKIKKTIEIRRCNIKKQTLYRVHL
jgi:hypothetical protein